MDLAAERGQERAAALQHGRLAADQEDQLAAAGLDGPTMLLGFEVDRVALRSALRRAVDRGPLLPPSLGGGRIAKDAVSLRVTDPFGGEMLVVGEGLSPLLAAEKRLGPDPNGILQDFVVRTAIDPAR